jgi:hypothetical protein
MEAYANFNQHVIYALGTDGSMLYIKTSKTLKLGTEHCHL